MSRRSGSCSGRSSSPPGQTWEGDGDLYVGPKEWDQLRALGVGLEAAQARNYGRFAWVLFPMWWFCVPLLWLMNFFGTWLPGQNYGVAIILLTVLVKVVFYPLSLKSMRSMKADAGAPAAAERAALEVQVRSPAVPARADGDVPEAGREPHGRLPPHGRADPHLLRALPDAPVLGGAPGGALSCSGSPTSRRRTPTTSCRS